MTPKITFGPNANPATVSHYTVTVITDVLVAAEIGGAIISSTQRSPHDQARVMYDNIATHGVAAQMSLYREPGQAVIQVYADNTDKPRDQVIALMEAKIVELGPYNVSHHAADPAVLNVLDIAPSSIPELKHAALEQAAEKDSRISKFLKPPKDPGFHFEIPQTA